jgi:ParB family chromosome partitioning protein
MPEEVQERCRQADIVSKSMLLQIVRQDSVDQMHRLIDRISGDGITREEARRFGQDEGERPRPRSFVFRFEPEDESFRFRLSFAKAEVDRHEVIRALESVLEKLRQAPPGGNGGREGIDWSSLSDPS